MLINKIWYSLYLHMEKLQSRTFNIEFWRLQPNTVLFQSSPEYLLTANTYFVRELYDLRYQGKGNLSAENNSKCQETNLPLKM